MNFGIYQPKHVLTMSEREVMRYAGMPKCTDEKMLLDAEDAIRLCTTKMQPICVYRYFEITDRTEHTVTLAGKVTLSGSLVSKYLCDCRSLCMVIGTVGLAVDRMIAAKGSISSYQQLLADAAGSTAIEALMDDFCNQIPVSMLPKPRISPGYGDFSIENQKVIFGALDAFRMIGACLGDSLLISPSKSVSAIIGCGKELSCLI